MRAFSSFFGMAAPFGKLVIVLNPLVHLGLCLVVLRHQFLQFALNRIVRVEGFVEGGSRSADGVSGRQGGSWRDQQRDNEMKQPFHSIMLTRRGLESNGNETAV